MRFSIPFLVVFVVAAVSLGRQAAAQGGSLTPPPLLTAPHAPPAALAEEENASQHLSDLITDIVREAIPHEFEERKNWDKKTEVWSGLDVWQEGGRIKTRGQKKSVNHGTWQRFRVRLVDPTHQFHVRVENVRELPAARVAFAAWVEAQLDVYGQLAEWQRGVKLVSLSTEADAAVRLRVQCDLGMKLDPTKFPPDVLLDPTVQDAALELTSFRLRRVGEFHGPVVRGLGEAAQEVLENKVADQRQKLVERINRQIDKRRSKLRISLHDLLVSQWGQLVPRSLSDGAQPP